MTPAYAMGQAALIKDVQTKFPGATINIPEPWDVIVALADCVEQLSSLAAIGHELCNTWSNGMVNLRPLVDKYRQQSRVAFGHDDEDD